MQMFMSQVERSFCNKRDTKQTEQARRILQKMRRIFPIALLARPSSHKINNHEKFSQQHKSKEGVFYTTQRHNPIQNLKCFFLNLASNKGWGV